MHFGIVAGEASGDMLAAGLIAEIKKIHPDATFEGIAGPLMIEQGCKVLHPLEKLSVFGLVEVLKDLPELLAIRKDVRKHFIANPPDVFIGIDAPDFNFSLEEQLKQQGIKVAHYVAPTVWAWREYRVHKVKRAVDLLLCIFPFEEKYFAKFDMPAVYVGHPLAESIPFEIDQKKAREKLGLSKVENLVAILPGSRKSEVAMLGDAFLETAHICLQSHPRLHFVVPMATQKTRMIFEKQLAKHPELPITLVDGQSDVVLAACDVTLMASGTATLEALLYKRPMVIAYKVSGLTYWLVKTLKLMKISSFAMANLIAGKKIAPEFIQHDVVPKKMAKVVMNYLDNPEERRGLQIAFLEIHFKMRQNSSEKAAKAVLDLLELPLSQNA
ncbi:MAG: lipid-A-disaccharide synthase [Methylococcales bacterium]|jgi:lipid-A-disaccharide synthase|nr:lipid-A-disaccharide synthase [Methylococcales bacterium]MBT7443849.1 lipid-A-disaccharide synthase [Methylococcales bacterium]